MRIQHFWLVAASVVPCLALAACGGNNVPVSPSSAGLAQLAALESPRHVGAKVPKSKIKHVVVIIQENRSFDNMFQGYPGANTSPTGLNSKGQTITLAPIGLEVNYQIDHSSHAFFAACDGSPLGQNCKMDGFDKETAYGVKLPQNPQYGYVPPAESAPYFAMAKEFALSDNTFTSHIDMSFVSHQYLIAGQAASAVDLPSDATAWGCGGNQTNVVDTLNQDRSYGPTESPCFDYQTVGDELDAKKLSWRYYAPAVSDPAYIWSAYQAVNHIYNGPDWTKDVISPSSQFLTDIGAGKLSDVTYIVPTCANSDHSGCQSNTGPAWVASLVNAVGQSSFWKTTAVFVVWDEWGGWYDHVPPPYMDYDGLGMRVPMLAISPYAKPGYVSHVQYETASILRFIEDNFGLAQLAAADTRAVDPVGDMFNYKQKALKFVPISTSMKPDDFIHALPDTRPPDDD
jgi:phospholipase C